MDHIIKLGKCPKKYLNSFQRANQNSQEELKTFRMPNLVTSSTSIKPTASRYPEDFDADSKMCSSFEDIRSYPITKTRAPINLLQLYHLVSFEVILADQIKTNLPFIWFCYISDPKKTEDKTTKSGWRWKLRAQAKRLRGIILMTVLRTRYS